MRNTSRSVATAAVLAAALGAAVAATPPAGFSETLLVGASATTGAAVPTGIDYEPGSGNLFVLEKGAGASLGNARVRRRAAGTGTITTALDLPCVDSRGERGLLGIAFHPGYLGGAGSRWVYLYYTRAAPASGTCSIAGTSGSRNRVARFLESGGTLSGEQVILEGPVLTGAENHNGGTLRFAPDGTLFVSMGDNDSDAAVAPFSRNLGDLRGKILRINADGTIPADNPFVGQAGRRGEVWAFGLRNPFRFSIDPANGRLWIADVGEDTWEEIDEGLAGADYGYPCLEGPQPFRTCATPPDPTFLKAPAFYYSHFNATPPVQGESVTGGPVYRATAFPAEYRGNLFFGDYQGGWIRRARVNDDGSLSNVTMFAPDATRVVDLAVSPAGCLTWVGITGDGVRDICYAGSANGQPIAVTTASPTSGAAPLDVQFVGSGSSDPDGDPLAYAWTFGDGGTSTAANPAHSYDTGVFDAVLTVNDGQGQPNSSASAPALRIVSGNRAPTGTISAPTLGAAYNAGQVVGYAGTGSDPEDGTLAASAFSWLVVFHHGDHTHPFLGPITGATSGTFTIPASGEDAVDVFYRVHLTVTDSGAPVGSAARLSHTSFRDVVPNVTTITAAASPAGAGLRLAIDHQEGPAPRVLDSVVGFPRTLTAPSPQTVGAATWTFASWSDGGAAEHLVTTSFANTTYTATFACTAGCGGTDSDGDGVLDTVDNCPQLANAGQQDFDDDGRGDACETGAALADVDRSGRVDGRDLARLGRAFASASGGGSYDAGSDLDRDDDVDGDDLALFAARFGQTAP